MRSLALLLTLASATAAADPATPATPAIDAATAAGLLYGSAAPPACSGDDAIPCLIAHRYAKDARAKTAALALYAETGDIAGVGDDEIMDGGYRGKIHLVPELPIGGYRAQLGWTLDAMRAIDAFFAAQYPTGTPPPAYRWRALGFKFVRSVGKRTPSAYATSWTVTYNVEGSLLTSAGGVLETLFHELFHDNDEVHKDWSATALAADYTAILARCVAAAPRDARGGEAESLKRELACLAPYAPNTTVVRGGTYYAFQRNNGNGVHEYAAELAVRYFREQGEMQRAGKLRKPAFKCGPAENARSWKALVDEFFAGRDLTPAC